MTHPFCREIPEFLNPMGEGISAGMESGYCAASAIEDRHIQGNGISIPVDIIGRIKNGFI